MNKPIIGIVLDWTPHSSFSPRPHYALRDGYFSAVSDAGGLPIGLPLLEGGMEPYFGLVQGIIVPGGDYPSPSRWYGDGHGIPDEHPRTIVNETLIRTLLKLDFPFLAICAGLQEMVVATGGLLQWSIKDSVKKALDHRSIALTEQAHPIYVQPGSLLHRLVGAETIKVNSHHNEAAKTLGHGVEVSGTSPDGVIEAVEVKGKTFALGVQWHPEFNLSPADHALFVGLVNAAQAYGLKTKSTSYAAE